MGEILDPAQRQAVQATIDGSLLTVVRVEEPREIELYAEMRRVLGDGEAASLAIAEHRGWGFVSYEGRRLAREAMTRLGATRFLRTPEVLAGAVHAGLIDLHALHVAVAHTRESQTPNPPRLLILSEKVPVSLRKGTTLRGVLRPTVRAIPPDLLAAL